MRDPAHVGSRGAEACRFSRYPPQCVRYSEADATAPLAKRERESVNPETRGERVKFFSVDLNPTADSADNADDSDRGTCRRRNRSWPGICVHLRHLRLNRSEAGLRLRLARVFLCLFHALYRLTSETIVAGVGDPGPPGTIGYNLDKVGNRSSRSSSVSSVPSLVNQSYNARDWLDTATYDANGNTVSGLQPTASGRQPLPQRRPGVSS